LRFRNKYKKTANGWEKELNKKDRAMIVKRLFLRVFLNLVIITRKLISEN